MSNSESCTHTDPKVAAMAASDGTNNLVDVEVTGPMGPVPSHIDIPVSQVVSSTPIAAVPLRSRESPQSSVNKQKRQRNGKWTVVPDRSSMKKNMDWLPLDWTIMKKDRLNGASAGRADHEFVAPNGIRCRSKKEVMDYREHRILPKTTSNALRRKLSENLFETHRQNNEDEEKIEDEQKEDDEQKEAEEKVEEEPPAPEQNKLKDGCRLEALV